MNTPINPSLPEYEMDVLKYLAGGKDINLIYGEYLITQKGHELLKKEH